MHQLKNLSSFDLLKNKIINENIQSIHLLHLDILGGLHMVVRQIIMHIRIFLIIII